MAKGHQNSKQTSTPKNFFEKKNQKKCKDELVKKYGDKVALATLRIELT